MFQKYGVAIVQQVNHLPAIRAQARLLVIFHWKKRGNLWAHGIDPSYLCEQSPPCRCFQLVLQCFDRGEFPVEVMHFDALTDQCLISFLTCLHKLADVIPNKSSSQLIMLQFYGLPVEGTTIGTIGNVGDCPHDQYPMPMVGP
jgi:hypothetical protein